MKMSKQTKKCMELFFVQLNDTIHRYESDDYLSKQHLIDAIDGLCQKWINVHKLDSEKMNDLFQKIGVKRVRLRLKRIR